MRKNVPLIVGLKTEGATRTAHHRRTSTPQCLDPLVLWREVVQTRTEPKARHRLMPGSKAA